MKNARAILLAAFAGASLALTSVALTLVWGGMGARPDPSRLEVSIARELRRAAIPAAARALTNPLQATPEVLAEARAHFADHCATCHANDGSGTTGLGQRLYPRAPDMRLAETQRLTDGEIYYIIENGVRLTGMPSWGTPGAEPETWKLVHFIRHLPSLTPDEKLEMERLNPRGPDEWRELEDEERFLHGEIPATPRKPSHGGH